MEALFSPLRHPDRDLREAVLRVGSRRLSNEILRFMERSLITLAPTLLRAVIDLFSNAHRYRTAEDIALQAGVPLKTVYREFVRADLGTPKRMLVVAKVVRGYIALRDIAENFPALSTQLGYARSTDLAKQIREVLGCSPLQVRTDERADEVIRALLDWLYKGRGNTRFLGDGASRGTVPGPVSSGTYHNRRWIGSAPTLDSPVKSGRL